MEYFISDISKMFNLSISTIRYYDTLGLLKTLKKNNSGVRVFTENEIETLRMIEYLKKSGMKLHEIKEFIDWCALGDETLEKRLNLFKKQKIKVQEEINKLEETLNLIKYKEWYYTQAVNDKTEQNLKNMDITKLPEEILKYYKKCHE